jgi:hypothetical protein
LLRRHFDAAAAFRTTGGLAFTSRAGFGWASPGFGWSSFTGGSGFPFENAAFWPYFATIRFFVSSPVASITKFGTRRARLSAIQLVIPGDRRAEAARRAAGFFRLGNSARIRASTAAWRARRREGRTRATMLWTDSLIASVMD